MSTIKKDNRSGYNVGYGKPPVHSRFPRGVSGNPGGRPRGASTERSKSLLIKEAYREITVMDNGKRIRMPAFQAMLRNLMAHAAKGNMPATRLLLDHVFTTEAQRTAAKEQSEMSHEDWIDQLG